jgi:hypothetical protein
MTEKLRTPVVGPAAWQANEFTDENPWIYTLSRSDIQELNNAMRQTVAQNLECYAFSKEDFPLPSFGPKIEGFLEELENGRGFMLLRGIPVERYDDKALYRLYWGLSTHLGTPVSQNNRGEKIVEINDRGEAYGPGVRGYTTKARLMPHSDASDLVALFCIHPARRGGASCIASGMTIFNKILAERPQYLEILELGFHHNMRGEGVSNDPNETTKNAIPVFSYYQGRLSCHFNRRLIREGGEKSGAPLSEHAKTAVDYVNELALRDDIRFDMDFQAGDVQLLNNHVIMHSRFEFDDYEAMEKRRRLLRLWTTVPNGRPLAPEYADRTNNGPRSGMAVLENTPYFKG